MPKLAALVLAATLALAVPAQANDITATAGITSMGGLGAMPVAGLRYQAPITDWLAWRAGVEAGASGGVPVARLPGGVVTTGWAYAGAGLNAPLYAGLMTSAMHATIPGLYPEAIAGLRGDLAMLSLGIEARWGIGGPTTATANAGIKF